MGLPLPRRAVNQSLRMATVIAHNLISMSRSRGGSVDNRQRLYQIVKSTNVHTHAGIPLSACA